MVVVVVVVVVVVRLEESLAKRFARAIVAQASDSVHQTFWNLMKNLRNLMLVCENERFKIATIPPARSRDRQEDLRIAVLSVLFEEGCENENTRTRG